MMATPCIDRIELGAVGVLGVNSERPGGITLALRAIDYAAARGLGTVLHNQPLGIASAAQVHLGAARADVLGHAMELFGHVMLEDDLILEPLDYGDGQVRIPDGPGFGVTLDEAALDRYATGPAVVLALMRQEKSADLADYTDSPELPPRAPRFRYVHGS